MSLMDDEGLEVDLLLPLSLNIRYVHISKFKLCYLWLTISLIISKVCITKVYIRFIFWNTFWWSNFCSYKLYIIRKIIGQNIFLKTAQSQLLLIFGDRGSMRQNFSLEIYSSGERGSSFRACRCVTWEQQGPNQ
jgi:hypothetical protein